jgi:hypothetical protein
MMKKRAVLALLAIVAGATVASRAAPAQQFSADIVATGAAEAPDAARRIYVADGKVRIETAGEDGAQIIIADTIAESAVALLPQQKAFKDVRRLGRPVLLLLPVDPDDPCPRWREMARAGGERGDEAWACTRLGHETIGGRGTVKFAARSPGGEQRIAWIDPTLRFIVKGDDAHGAGFALRNVVEGPQPAGLFAIPTEYQDLELQEMMRLMFQPGLGRTPRN